VSFARCEQLFREHPYVRDSAECFYGWSLAHPDQADRVLERFKRIVKESPDNSEMILNLAYLTTAAGPKEKLYKNALSNFQNQGNIDGELRVRDSWWRFLVDRGELKEATYQRAQMLALKSKTEDPANLARIDLVDARHLYRVELDFAGSLRIFQPLEQRLAEVGNYRLSQRCLRFLAKAYLELGMSRRSFYYFQKEAELAHQNQDPAVEAQALADSLLALREQVEESSRPADRSRALTFAEEALENVEGIGFPAPHATVLLMLAELRRDDTSKALYTACMDLSREVPEIGYLYKACYLRLAALRADEDPSTGIKMINELWEEVPSTSDPWEEIFDLHNEMRVFWQAGRYDEAWEDAERALDAIEEFREAQRATYGRAQSVSAWAMTYPWLAGRLLNTYQTEGSEEHFQRALYVIERMRARLLLDLLETMDATPRETPDLLAKRKERNEVAGRINQLQRRLRLGGLSDSASRTIREEVETLKQREDFLRSEITELSGRFSDLERPEFADFPSVGTLQTALQPHEALFSFQLAPWQSPVEEFAGGSWLLVLTRETTAAYRLPNGDEIAQWVTALAGRLDQSRSATALEARLHDELLGEALSALPPHITNLIVIPDKALHRLPFAALRPAKDAPPLATRYRFSRIPSVTLWLRRWRQEGPPLVPSQPALVLADPASFEDEEARADGSQVASLMRDGDHLFRADSYGPLPFAQQEGWSVLRQLGPGTEILTGFEASERSLKMAVDLDRFGILHFAAHAIANEEEPDRAGVLLAPDPTPPANGKPGDEIYDGMLQFNEIVDLRFKGRTVVLSTCHSARGQILRGEGVFDLARAFFEGGARAVVGSLWKLEDKATARFFDDFYRHLARGGSLSEALHQAQKDQIDRGVPPSVWAGIVVIGDGSLVPVPSRGGRQHPGWPIAIALVLLALAVGLAARRNP